MANNVNPNKVDDKQKRQADHLKHKFEHQGMGRDEAEDRALEEVARQPNTGGGNSAGDAPRHDNNERDHRNGSGESR